MENPIANGSIESQQEEPNYNSRKEELSKHVPPENDSVDLEERLSDEPGSLGIDLDGTNPGSRSHEMDIDED